MRAVLALAIWGAAAGTALAQPAPSPGDSVTVTGEKARKVIEGFIKSMAVPTRLTGKMARWEVGVCPLTVGLKPAFAAFISQRLRDVAAQVDAPVNKAPGCKPNIEIVFTTSPQGLADTIRKTHDAYLGYSDSSAQRDKLAIVTRPIQAWYLTTTTDLAGKTVIDSGRVAGAGDEVTIPLCPMPQLCSGGQWVIRSLSPLHAMLTNSAHLGDGLRSGFNHVIIVADPTKLLDVEMGAVADYIALLALSQVQAPDKCQALSSIVNLLPDNCERQTGMTVADLGYLRGLYHMNAGQMLSGQQNHIAYQMGQALAGR